MGAIIAINAWNRVGVATGMQPPAIADGRRLTRNDGRVLRLLTIPISHYCEKARWALDRAGSNTRRSLTSRASTGSSPGGPAARGRCRCWWRTRASTANPRTSCATPTAGLGDERLFPAEHRSREEVIGVCRRLDAGLGPDARRLIYAHMLPRAQEMLPVNNQGVPAWEDRLPRRWPLVKRWGRASWASARRRSATTNRASASSTRWRAARGRAAHLCGDRFSAADLTFAAWRPRDRAAGVRLPLPQPEELPDPIAADVLGFREHPAGAFALRLFRTQRRRARARRQARRNERRRRRQLRGALLVSGRRRRRVAGGLSARRSRERALSRARRPELAERGLHVAGVAGAARFHGEALASSDSRRAGARAAARPRQPARPQRHRGPRAGGGGQVGWVPRELAAEIAPELDAGRPWSAVVLREQRASPRDPRTGLTMLLAPDEAIELREVSPGLRRGGGRPRSGADRASPRRPGPPR